MGAALRSFVEVIEAVEAYCPWVTTVRPGICSLPARGPARYFGGEGPLVRSVAEATSAITTVEVGVADGLFAAVLAARHGLVVPVGTTPAFLAPFPVSILGRPELAELLNRLGLRTLGDFAAIPEAHVVGRFGADGVACHRVAGGRHGELDELRQPAAARRVGEQRATGRGRRGGHGAVGEPEFWGGVSDTDVPGRAGPRRRAGPPRPGRGGDRRASRGAADRPSGPASSPGTPGRDTGTPPSVRLGPARSRHPPQWSCTLPLSPPNWSTPTGSRYRSRGAACSPPAPPGCRWRSAPGRR